jgi:hypothetical protein
MLVENIISLTSYNNPIIPIFSTYYRFLHPEMIKITNIVLQMNSLFTDSAIISSENKEEQFNKMIELQSDMTTFDKNSKRLSNINFYSSNRSDLYYRKYIKITEIIASVGRLIEVMMIVCTFINIPFRSLKKYQILFYNLNNTKFVNNKNNDINNDNKD